MTNERREQIRALADRLAQTAATQGEMEALGAIRELFYAKSHPRIDQEDVQFSEYEEHGRVIVIASVRYAIGVIVDREAINDFGDGVMTLARRMALKNLLASAPVVPIHGEIWKDHLHLPPIKTGEEKPRC